MTGFDELKAIVEAATAGTLAYGEMPVETMKGLADRTVQEGRATDASKVWVSFLQNEDGTSTVVAVTGNGPNSEANARFFAGARNVMLRLIDDVQATDDALQALQALLQLGKSDRARELVTLLLDLRSGAKTREDALPVFTKILEEL
jgi:hypothetical protein